MHQIRIEITFDSGHRLLDYDGKCAYPHGHTYRAEVFLKSQSLDSLGLVFDFTELKGRVKDWIDDNWDHAFSIANQMRRNGNLNPQLALFEALELELNSKNEDAIRTYKKLLTHNPTHRLALLRLKSLLENPS